MADMNIIANISEKCLTVMYVYDNIKQISYL